MVDSKKTYGLELIMDLHGCDASTFNRESLDNYFEKLCKAIDMQKCERYFWDDVGVSEEEKQRVLVVAGRAVDLACGEGRNAVYLAKHGFEVTGVDTSAPGLEKTRRYAEEVRVAVKTVHAVTERD